MENKKLPPNRSNIDFDSTRRINIKDIAVDDTKVEEVKKKKKKAKTFLLIMPLLALAGGGGVFFLKEKPQVAVTEENVSVPLIKKKVIKEEAVHYYGPAETATTTSSQQVTVDSTTYIDATEYEYPTYEEMPDSTDQYMMETSMRAPASQDAQVMEDPTMEIPTEVIQDE